MAERFTFLEFFAGGGMARLGLGDAWRCLFANDFDAGKRTAYGANFGLDHHRGGDIHALTIDDMPRQTADLAWASSPCQDLSLAGARGGLGAARSGAFFGFWRLIEALDDARRAPRVLVVENVTGLLTSHGGADFAAVVERMAAQGYFVSALVLNAASFVPQSRPRLFIVGMRVDALGMRKGAEPLAPPALAAAVARLSPHAALHWRWIAERPSHHRTMALADILEERAAFDPAATTRARLAAMAPHQRAALGALVASGGRHIGAGYRRVRVENGVKRVRFEARFDDLSGCIRTPAGGSSRQVIVVIDGGNVRTRLMTPREAARSMGLPDEYSLPARATAALKLVGDGVAPPVVRWLAEMVIEPALARRRAAA
ncbi:MAG: DNA cytosine methyltransferase [Parvularculaceae bacterium]|nr:DNA cytosine methyltransferase [Parvularculaceae bacterium]